MNISLEKTEPKEKTDTTWTFTVIASVKDGNRVISGQEVWFLLEAEPYEDSETTEGDGTASKKFTLPEGNYTIFARLADGTSKKIVVEIERKKREIALDKTEPKKIDENWKFSVIATVKKGTAAASKEKVKFYLGTEERGEETTESDGTASMDFTVPAGKHTIFARLADGTSKKIVVDITDDTSKKKPAQILIAPSGKDGEHVVTFQVLTEDNLPVVGAVVLLTENDEVTSKLPPTDKDGAVVALIEFVDKMRRIDAQVLGSNVRNWTYLYND